MILLIDNFDSFVHNLARYLVLLGQETRVIRNHRVTPADLLDPDVSALVISPGPGSPDAAGRTLELLPAAIARLPVLGVCLGHQAVVQALGGRIQRAPEPIHGRRSAIFHDGRGEFRGLPSPFPAARYHSLVADPAHLPEQLEVSAQTSEGVIMAVRHRQLPVVGWQFHPESILTECGLQLLQGFLRLADSDLK